LLKEASKWARRLACGPLAGTQCSIKATLRVARETGKEKARTQRQNADDDDCSDDHLGSPLGRLGFLVVGGITPSDCHLCAPRGSRVSVEARLRAKLASAEEGVQCGRMGRARELALTHERHGPERFKGGRRTSPFEWGAHP